MPSSQPKYAIELNEEQGEQLTPLSRSYTRPFCQVQRAQILLLAYDHPDCNNQQIGPMVGCHRQTVRACRRHWRQEGHLEDSPPCAHRGGSPLWSGPKLWPWLAPTRRSTARCASTGLGRSWLRWRWKRRLCSPSAPAPFAAGCARTRSSPGTITPGRSPLVRSSCPKPLRLLDLYQEAQALAQQGELVCSTDEKTSIQARHPLTQTQPAVPGHPVQVSHGCERQGALQLFCSNYASHGRVQPRDQPAGSRFCLLQYPACSWGASARVLDYS
jgi:hypothetical protein